MIIPTKEIVNQAVATIDAIPEGELGRCSIALRAACGATITSPQVWAFIVGLRCAELMKGIGGTDMGQNWKFRETTRGDEWTRDNWTVRRNAGDNVFNVLKSGKLVAIGYRDGVSARAYADKCDAAQHKASA